MSGTSNHIMTVNNLSIKYTNKRGWSTVFEHIALDDISFHINQSEVLGVIGRNGCGKSTLLRVLAGIVPASTGIVHCNPNITRSLLTLGLGFRQELSGRDNALISSMLQGVNKKVALQKMDEMHEFTELGEFFDQPVRTYSAGMRARLGFALAIINSVDVLFIDEVLSVGDAKFRAKAEQVMTNKLNSGQTVVFVSHNIAQVNKICDRIIWIRDGKIYRTGAPKEVTEEYREYMAQ
ncbi:MAG: ATP-binding cassette domain-containing protein [Gammaproteobacteria bacterium]|nr:ATP-binding cassette domain-containing protein [Gammaproteobacteria bacterium]